MSSAVAALPLATAKSPKKRAKSQRKKTAPTVSDQILKAISASTERGGVSLVALKKALKAGGYDVEKNKARILTAIKRLVANKSIIQVKGTGASGSFKANKKTPTPRKKKVVRKKKPRGKSVKRVSATTATTDGAAPAVKKSPKKKRKTKSPKKVKKPVAAKKLKSPRKVKRSVVKSTRTRAASKK